MQEYNNQINYTCTNIQIDAYDHILECYLPTSIENILPLKTIPPPYDVWGTEARWKILKCKSECMKFSMSSFQSVCLEHCIKEGQRKEELKQSVLKNYNTVFGITRNKVFANYFRAKKAQDMEDDGDEVDEEEDHVEEEEDENDDDDDDDVEEEEEDEEEDEEEEEEEEEDDEDGDDDEKEVEDDVSLSESEESSSTASSEVKKPKRKPKQKI
jgi:hypothetical protein